MSFVLINVIKLLLLVCWLNHDAESFVVNGNVRSLGCFLTPDQVPNQASLRLQPLPADATAAASSAPHPSSQKPRMGELTPPETKVYELLHDIHSSGHAFRVVVIGKGAILEFTTPAATGLGPKLSISQSPSSGANLLTLAADDASWEYHVQLSQVSKIVLVEKKTPSKTLRIVRLLNAEGESMSSLILVVPETEEKEGRGDAIQWFHNLVERYGSELQL